jgi:hypothetical protein
MADHGARVAASLHELAAGSNVIITMLSDGPGRGPRTIEAVGSGTSSCGMPIRTRVPPALRDRRESSDVRWVPPSEPSGYTMDRSMRIRINDFLSCIESPVIT